jgi:hypothetical protein
MIENTGLLAFKPYGMSSRKGAKDAKKFKKPECLVSFIDFPLRSLRALRETAFPNKPYSIRAGTQAFWASQCA